jgi:hypothetical protein
MFKSHYMRAYIGIGLATVVYLLFFDGFVYSHGNWMTQIPASILMAALWPLYWGVLYWMF